VYARDVNDQKLTFAVSGKLWNRSLVIQDEETNSLWSHLLGEAMQGPLKGKRLEQIPSVMTDWEAWRREHPGGTVVVWDRTSRDYTRDAYKRLGDFVLGVVLDGKANAWGFDHLQKNPLLQETFQGHEVLVVFDKPSATARLFDRRIKDRVLTFHLKDSKRIDRETGSVWNPITGAAEDGPLKGAYLHALPAIVSFRTAWMTFHPQSKLAGN